MTKSFNSNIEVFTNTASNMISLKSTYKSESEEHKENVRNGSKKSKKRKIIFIVSLILILIVIFICGIVCINKINPNAYKNLYVLGIDMSGKSLEQIAQELNEKFANYIPDKKFDIYLKLHKYSFYEIYP